MSAYGPIISEIVEVIRELSADPIGKKVINQLINSIIELIGQNRRTAPLKIVFIRMLDLIIIIASLGSMVRMLSSICEKVI